MTQPCEIFNKSALYREYEKNRSLLYCQYSAERDITQGELFNRAGFALQRRTGAKAPTTAFCNALNDK